MSKTNMNQKGKMPKKVLLTDEDLMDIFGVSKITLKRWREKEYLNFISFGTRNYYPSKALRKMIKQTFHPYYKSNNKQQDRNAENEKTNGEA